MGGTQVTWWGHSTIWLEDSGVRLLTDPVLTNRIAHLRRRVGPTPRLPGAPDAVLLSHLHADHCHVSSLRRLPGEPTLVVPRGAAAFLRRTLGADVGRRCVEVDRGDEVELGPVRVQAVPAAHDGGRGLWSSHRATAVGFVIEGAARSWYAGDTGLFAELAAIGPVDLALVPVGGWGPTLGAGHLDPVQAAEALRRVRAATAVPVHYGTFWPIGFDRVRPHLFHDPATEFARHAARTTPRTRVHVLPHGETLHLDRAPR